MPEPVPEDPDVTVNQLALEIAVHEHVEEEAVTVTEPVWTELSTDAEDEFRVVVHAGGGGGGGGPEPPIVIG